MTTGRGSTVKWNAQCNLPRSDPGPCPHFDGEPECFGGGDVSVEIYPSIYCLGTGVALCVGAISILGGPPDNGPPAWFAAVLGAMFFWGAFALARWKHQ